jgi:hypothetical protein
MSSIKFVSLGPHCGPFLLVIELSKIWDSQHKGKWYIFQIIATPYYLRIETCIPNSFSTHPYKLQVALLGDEPCL